jgi:phosphatidylglycerophosphate synthase
MLENITYALIFGKPVILYLGIITLLSFLVTASIAVMALKGIRTIPFKWHPRLAVFSIFLAVVHGTLGLLLFF